MPKLKKLNDGTAIDKKGRGWFRGQTAERHYFWVTCKTCGKKTRFFWFAWPDDEDCYCETCVEWEEENEN